MATLEAMAAWEAKHDLRVRDEGLRFSRLRYDAARRGVSRAGIVALTAQLFWTQKRGYVEDHPGEEWFQPLVWTMEYGGDCEDLANLFVGLCRSQSIASRLVWFDQKNHKLNHVCAQVLVGEGMGIPTDGRGWAWAECSMEGALLGEHPYDAVARLNRYDVFGITEPT